MSTATLTSKGQITIPKQVRDALGLEAGDRIEFLVRPNGVVELFPRVRDLMSLAGTVHVGAGASSGSLDASIAAAVSEEFERSTR